MNIRDVVAGKHTQQEVVNFVFEKLAEQGRCATEPGTTSCRFRDSVGGKCAIGHLILDEEYRKEMEAGGVSRVAGVLGLPPLAAPVYALLQRLQAAHDRTASHVFYGESFRTALGRYFLSLCHDYRLEMPKWPSE